MKRDATVVKKSLENLINQVENMTAEEQDTMLKELLLRLHSQYPGDVGCFCMYFMNHMLLSPVEAIFLIPNHPHAYLSGVKH